MKRAYFIFIGLSLIAILNLGCKSKYEKAFEEFDKREYYSSPTEGEESLEEIELLSNAIKFKPELSALYYYRANQYELFGEYEKAVKDYKICIKQNWTFGYLYYNKGICELELKNFEVATSDFQRAKKIIEEEWKEVPEKKKEPNHWGSPIMEHHEMLEELENKIASAKRK